MRMSLLEFQNQIKTPFAQSKRLPCKIHSMPFTLDNNCWDNCDCGMWNYD